MPDPDDLARIAAHDVAVLLDRRGLRELDELARRIRKERTWPDPDAPTNKAEAEPSGCTLRRRDRQAGHASPLRPVDDRNPD